MRRVAVVAASGIGDALLMMIAAHQLSMRGGEVDLYTPTPDLLRPLFDSQVKMLPYPEDFTTLRCYDLVILENDNSDRSYTFFNARNQTPWPALHVFFHKPSDQFREGDFLFDQKRSVAHNIREGLKRWIEHPTLENGLTAFKGEKTLGRILIHPTSNDRDRNWKLGGFIQLYHRLKKEGYSPIFTLHEKEAPLYPEIEAAGCELKVFQTLEQLATFYNTAGAFIGNDSGPGHLASNLGIPTLTISGNFKHVRKWRPGFCNGLIVTPRALIPNFKGLGLPLRDKYWQSFISPRRVFQRFKQLKVIS